MSDIPPAPPLPPPPGLPQAPMVSNEGLNVGDVVQIAVQLLDQTNGQPFWWKRFAVVTRLRGRHMFDALTLKMKPDIEKDHRTISYATDERERPQVITKLDEARWPQGVIAMRMKYIIQGYVKLEGG